MCKMFSVESIGVRTNGKSRKTFGKLATQHFRSHLQCSAESFITAGPSQRDTENSCVLWKVLGSLNLGKVFLRGFRMELRAQQIAECSPVVEC